MKVYTHFFKIDENEGFRWRTLLQFRDSWNCIGTVVMKNPGSSNFTSQAPISDSDLIDKLSEYRYENLEWYEFSVDPTMRYVGDLFAYKTGVSCSSQLSGVIQIFNLFYLKDADLSKAMAKAKVYGIPPLFSDTDQMTLYDINHLIAPVYLGFGGLAYNKEYGKRARQIFDATIKLKGCDYLSKTFEENFYYHPQWLMPFGKSRKNGALHLLRFKQNSYTPRFDDPMLLQFQSQCTANIKRIEKTVLERFKHFQYNNGHRLKHHSNSLYGITIAEGHIEIRQAFEGKFRTPQPIVSDSEIVNILNIRGYVQTDNWLGRKSLSKFGCNEEEIIENVCKEITHLISELDKFD